MRLTALGMVCCCVAALGQTVNVDVFKRMNYRFVGPANMGGRTADVEGVPGQPGILYVGTGGGGLWKTTNAGTTWTPLFEKQSTYSIGDLALDPNNPEVIWVGSGEANMRNSVSFGDGVYKSTDGGKTWKHLGLRDTEHIARVLVHPQNGDVAYVCALGHGAGPNDERGVFMTTDGGATWKKTLFVDNKHGCADMDINPVNPNILYASMWRFERSPWNHTSGSEQSGIHQSVDGGRTWKKLTNGLPKLIGRTGVKVAPSNPSIVYVAAESKEGTLYRSSNGGDSFQEMTRAREVVSRGFYYADIRVDPRDENRVYAIATALQVSVDGGRTFRTISRSTHSDYHSLWIDPKDPNRMWQGSDGGVAVSHDRGETWEAVLNIPLGQFYQIHADNALPFYNLTGGLQDNGTYRGPSRVRQPSGITNAEWQLISFGDGFHAYSHPDDPDMMLSESQGGSLILQDLKSGEQISASPQAKRGFVNQLKYRFNWNTPIVGSPHGKSTVFFGSNFLFQTSDFGRSWEPISPDLTTNNPEKLKSAGGPIWYDNSTAENHCTIISIGESPLKRGVIWVGTDDGNLQLTTDGGGKWTNLTPNITGLPANSPVSHVEPSRTGVDVAYAAFDRHHLDDFKPYIFKTTDGGKTWANIAANLPAKAYVHIVREDPKNTRLLYAGTELGLYASFNGGADWQFLSMANLPPVAVHDIVIHPRENDLILATHGRSVVILDDITPLQQMTSEIAAQPAHLFDVRPAIRHATPMRTYGGADKVFVGQNPPYGALITYYLKDKLEAKQTLKLEVLDSAGKVIREVDQLSREAGLNRIAWDLRVKGPELRRALPEEVTRFTGGPRGVQVVPGTYTLRLTAGDKVLEKKVEVRLDPALKTTMKELTLQYDTAEKVSKLATTVNVALKRMDSLATQLRSIERLGREQSTETGRAWSKQIADYLKEIDKQTEALGQKSTANRLEDPPGLADGIQGLFQTVSGGNSAPTPAQLSYLAELEKEVAQKMPAANEFLSKTAAGWSEALKKTGAPGLVGTQAVEAVR